MRRLILSLVGGAFVLTSASWAVAEKPAPDLAAGRAAYEANCARCHGSTGAGDGPDSTRLIPRPRDFSEGLYKFRTSASGTSPYDQDLFDTITHGLAETRMLGFEGLSEKTRWQLVYYIKSFSDIFEDIEPEPVDIGADPGAKKADLAKGKTIYDNYGCAACHGTLGRADGPSSKLLTDDWNQPSLPANLTHGWEYRMGSTPKDIVLRMMTGLDGTPMPSYAGAVDTKEIWHLAYYLHSLQEKPNWSWNIMAKKAPTLPKTMDDPLWRQAPRTDVKLWSNIYNNQEKVATGVSWAVVQAFFANDALVVKVAWDDPTKDTKPLPDQIALVFQPESVDWKIGSLQSWPGPNAPALDVHLWSATGQMKQATQVGFAMPASSWTLTSKARYDQGRWTVLFRRPLQITNGTHLKQSSAVPVALVVWDGGREETGNKRSASTWLNFHLGPQHRERSNHGTHH